MVKIRFDASVAESQQSIPDPQQSVSERVADSQDPVPGRVPDSQQIGIRAEGYRSAGEIDGDGHEIRNRKIRRQEQFRIVAN